MDDESLERVKVIAERERRSPNMMAYVLVKQALDSCEAKLAKGVKAL